jgi:hypothetical protein
MNTKAVSLTAELAEVRCAIEGARFIADALATHSLDSRKQELQAPVSISAILVLAELRLQQVERVLRGEEDPLHIWAPHNNVTPGSGEGEDQDIVLRPWTQAEKDTASSAQMQPEQGPLMGSGGQAPLPEPEPPTQPEGGGEQPPPSGTPT